MNGNWKKLLAEAKTLTRANGSNAWRCSQIVRDLFRDAEFVEECGNKPEEMESRLAEISGRFALGVNDMIQMIEHFPDKSEWETGRLDILRDKTCKLISARLYASRNKKDNGKEQPNGNGKHDVAVEEDASTPNDKPRTAPVGRNLLIKSVEFSKALQDRNLVLEAEAEKLRKALAELRDVKRDNARLKEQIEKLRKENARLKQQLALVSRKRKLVTA